MTAGEHPRHCCTYPLEDRSQGATREHPKDDARTSAERICRQYASLIKPNAGISDPDKLAIGVPPVNTDRNPINIPDRLIRSDSKPIVVR